MAMKRGLVLTLSIILMASAFLYLLAAISAYSHSMKEIAVPLSDFEALGAQYDSAEYGVKSILFNEGMSVSNEGTKKDGCTLEATCALPVLPLQSCARWKGKFLWPLQAH
jgi:hypothetical protein